ncbi:unnamed protein product [Notodromas monacha]|uniref:U2 snRNP-associated SURP motif-containing protein n=1 Tax=Notodromas monacha TaxID=399045 RepID=A0A7R9BFQ8_9CRUS|nr:unnamed protein product [Notodromas monacha]CAG0913285.1 unnamed protein product [Notodromas monacha]
MNRNAQSKHLSRRELEEMKKKRDEEEAAKVFGEFVATFDDSPLPKADKVWVRAGTFDAGSRTEDSKDRGKLYKPASKRDVEVKKELDPIFPTEDKPDRPGKKKKDGKKKSNLELFKEELQKIQEERQERFKLKHMLSSSDSPSVKDKPVKPEPIEPRANIGISLALDAPAAGPPGSFDNGDPTTTNLYLGNLHPKVSEQQLVEVFGKYGPLASVKIMWPRTDEERQRGKNCGFVAFMTRKDAERAMKFVSGTDLMGFEMKLGWGKAVPKPMHPVYVPPQLLELTMPPPPSGLPFNAQPLSKDKEWVLERSMVKVVIPTERQLLHAIHRMVEFVVREGPMFEAMIMNREIANPAYRFLFDNKSPAHIYYRWKLFSLLHGENVKDWETKEFRMFKGGSVWRPPPVNPYSMGMPEDLISDEEVSKEGSGGESDSEQHASDRIRSKRRSDAPPTVKRGGLSNSQRDRFEDMLRGLTPDRMTISEAMVFCIEHADSANEICECVAESLSILETPLSKKSFREKYESVESRMKAEAFKARVMRVFRAWEDWALYPTDVLIRLQNIFLGLSATANMPANKWEAMEEPSAGEEDIDGVPIGVDLDGVPMEDPELKRQKPIIDEDIDGVPLKRLSAQSLPGFKPSKWETVDPVAVADQAMTTSKWDTLEADEKPLSRSSGGLVAYDDDDIDGAPMESSPPDSRSNSPKSTEDPQMAEQRRLKLRELEIKVMEYTDMLESGQKPMKPGMSMEEHIKEFRSRLIRKVERDLRKSSGKSRRHSSSSEDDKRRISPKRARGTRSRSPHHRQRSRSPNSRHGRHHKRKSRH